MNAAAGRWAILLLLFVVCCGLLASASPPYKQENLIPAQGPTYSATEDYLKQIAASVDRIDKRLERMEKGSGTAPQNDALAIIGNRCLSCHQDPASKGDGFVLVEKDGTLVQTSLSEKRRIIRMVQGGKMPPSGKLPENEIKVLVEYFDPSKQEQKEKPK